MRSIAGFRRKYNRTNSNDTSTSSSININGSATIRSPTWGSRSAPVSPSQGSSSIGSSSSKNNKNYSRLSSPGGVSKSPIWSRSPRSGSLVVVKRKVVAPDKKLLAPPNVTANAGRSTTSRSLSCSPRPGGHRRRPSKDLCTIAEDRRISSNTLNKMVITTPAKQIARNPTIALGRPQQNFYGPPQPQQKTATTQSRDPYNDDNIYDNYMDGDENDCAECWAYYKPRIRNQLGCWFGFPENVRVGDFEKRNDTRGSSGIRHHSRSRSSQLRLSPL